MFDGQASAMMKERESVGAGGVYSFTPKLDLHKGHANVHVVRHTKRVNRHSTAVRNHSAASPTTWPDEQSEHSVAFVEQTCLAM
ncbi:hypothetical protein H4I96_10366 [Botrytis cinerea]